MLNWRQRIRASLIHLGFSGLVAALAAVLVFAVWYPMPYSYLAGGTKLFILITSVDVVMGPLLTLAVFDRRKPMGELRRDLAIIVTLQLVALAYGLHTMYVARPVAMVLEKDRLRVVSAVDVLMKELPLAPDGLRSLPLSGPRLLGTAPVSAEDRFEAIELAVTGYDIGTRPKYWRPWDVTGRQQALQNAKPVAELRQRFPQRIAELEESLARTGRAEADLRYLPIVSLHADAVALIDARSGDIVGYAGFDAF